jgi:hypothetical protein
MLGTARAKEEETVDAPNPHRTLIVANLTASTPILLQEVQRRADAEPTTFALLIPEVTSRKSADWTIDTARKLLEPAAGGSVEGLVGGADAVESIRQALADGGFDDVIISTLPKRTSEWLRRDLPRQVEQLGVPVAVITPPEEPSPLKAFTEQFSAKTPPTSGA